jgi:acetyl esterase
MGLRPELVAFLQARSESGLPEVWQAPVSTIRKNLENRAVQSGEPEKIYEVVHRYIPGPTADLPVRIYRPVRGAVLPALVFFHGGGWVSNNLDSYEQAMRSLANKGQFIVVAVNYQKAPELPFPIPFDDCYATLLWVAANSQSLGIEPTQIGVGGDSAGGNLAAAVALKARDTADVDLAFQLLIYPCNDNEMNYDSAYNNATGYGLSTQAMKWFWQQYLSKKSDLKNPYAVPVAAKDFSNLAPAIITTAEFDPLLDDGYIYAELLRKSGVQTVYREYDGVIHGYFSLAGITAEASVLHQHVADEINALLAR